MSLSHGPSCLWSLTACFPLFFLLSILFSIEGMTNTLNGRRRFTILHEPSCIYDVYCISRRQYQRFLNILFWVCLSGAVGSVAVWWSARRSCHGHGFESRQRQNISTRRSCHDHGFESRQRQNIYSIYRLSWFIISLCIVKTVFLQRGTYTHIVLDIKFWVSKPDITCYLKILKLSLHPQLNELFHLNF